MSSTDGSSGGRQRIERVGGSRRVRLTPAPGTAAEPVPADEADEATTDAAAQAGAGPNDDQLRRDVPPHY